MGLRLSGSWFGLLLAVSLFQQARPESLSLDEAPAHADESDPRFKTSPQARRKRGRRHLELHADGDPHAAGEHSEASDSAHDDFAMHGDFAEAGKGAKRQNALARTDKAVPSVDVSERMMGFLCVLVACIGFGSNFIPVKMVDTRDGMFFTLCMAIGIFLVGLVHWQVSGCYKFEPFAMLGGAIWAAGNLFVPFIVKRTGLGIGQLVWGVTNMLTGWATGTFGLFGKEVDTVADAHLNHIGVMISVLSLGIFTQMRPEKGDEKTGKDIEMQIARKALSSDFITGFIVAIFTGVLFGSNFNPPTYLQQLGMAAKAQGRAPVHSPDALDYVLSHFAGVLLMTTIAFVIYSSVSINCYVGKSLILPGLAAGCAWGIAQIAWFKANSTLSYVIAFPIIVGVPGIIAAIWGVVLFGENSGVRNLLLLAAAVVAQAVSVSMIAVSKDGWQAVSSYYS